MTLVSKTFELYGKTYTFESGELAKQATGACLVKQGDTTMLDTVVVSKERKNYDFFPLTVDFNEKMYAAGRIPGGYLKREGRPSEKATLTARMIDRPIRPSFPDGFRNEVHIVATSLVADQVNPFDVINVMGASLAMTLGGVPFEGPLACVRIGRNVETGEFIEKPDFAQYNKVVVPEDEAYGANCIWVNGTVIVPEGYPTVLKAVQDLGYKTLVVDTSEYRKVDGGLSCLSLRF